jgi:tetratricopeptide (TPR) repeat protein
VISAALNDGLFPDVLDAAERLWKMDRASVRGACVYGIALMKNNRLHEAERVLRSNLEEHGDDGLVLTNLAKVLSARHENRRAEDTLWHALEVDPNQGNGLGWYVAIHRERSDEEAGVEALRRVAALPNSWRAQLWLARAALESHDLSKALAYYHESLLRVAEPQPADFLMQMSGDLGKSGYLSELVQLTEPQFVAEIHGLQLGNNLIKAHLDLGEIEAAAKVLEQLHALKRPDYKAQLSFWEAEIAKARIARATVKDEGPLQMSIVGIEGPIWLKPSSAAAANERF